MSKVQLKKCADGLFRRYERKMASNVQDLTTGRPMVDPEAPESWDYELWVTTGVFKRRKDAFAR